VAAEYVLKSNFQPFCDRDDTARKAAKRAAGRVEKEKQKVEEKRKFEEEKQKEKEEEEEDKKPAAKRKKQIDSKGNKEGETSMITHSI